jgi:hypothetical protein
LKSSSNGIDKKDTSLAKISSGIHDVIEPKTQVRFETWIETPVSKFTSTMTLDMRSMIVGVFELLELSTMETIGLANISGF